MLALETPIDVVVKKIFANINSDVDSSGFVKTLKADLILNYGVLRRQNPARIESFNFPILLEEELIRLIQTKETPKEDSSAMLIDNKKYEVISKKYGRVRLMVIGNYKEGKSTVVAGLLGEDTLAVKGTVFFRKEIEVEDIVFDIWEFKGKTTYLPVQEIFLTDSGMYLVVFDIALFARNPQPTHDIVNSLIPKIKQSPVIFIGTGIKCTSEALEKARQMAAQYRNSFPNSEYFPLLSEKKEFFKKLTSQLVKLVRSNPNRYFRTVPPSYLSIIRQVLQLNKEYPIINKNEFPEYLETALPSSELENVTTVLSELNVITMFPSDQALQSLLLLDPELIIKILKYISKSSHPLLKEGIVRGKELSSALSQWGSLSEEIFPVICKVLESFGLIYRLRVRRNIMSTFPESAIKSSSSCSSLLVSEFDKIDKPSLTKTPSRFQPFMRFPTKSQRSFVGMKGDKSELNAKQKYFDEYDLDYLPQSDEEFEYLKKNSTLRNLNIVRLSTKFNAAQSVSEDASERIADLPQKDGSPPNMISKKASSTSHSSEALNVQQQQKKKDIVIGTKGNRKMDPQVTIESPSGRRKSKTKRRAHTPDNPTSPPVSKRQVESATKNQKSVDFEVKENVGETETKKVKNIDFHPKKEKINELKKNNEKIETPIEKPPEEVPATPEKTGDAVKVYKDRKQRLSVQYPNIKADLSKIRELNLEKKQDLSTTVSKSPRGDRTEHDKAKKAAQRKSNTLETPRGTVEENTLKKDSRDKHREKDKDKAKAQGKEKPKEQKDPEKPKDKPKETEKPKTPKDPEKPKDKPKDQEKKSYRGDENDRKRKKEEVYSSNTTPIPNSEQKPRRNSKSKTPVKDKSPEALRRSTKDLKTDHTVNVKNLKQLSPTPERKGTKNSLETFITNDIKSSEQKKKNRRSALNLEPLDKDKKRLTFQEADIPIKREPVPKKRDFNLNMSDTSRKLSKSQSVLAINPRKSKNQYFLFTRTFSAPLLKPRTPKSNIIDPKTLYFVPILLQLKENPDEDFDMEYNRITKSSRTIHKRTFKFKSLDKNFFWLYLVRLFHIPFVKFTSLCNRGVTLSYSQPKYFTIGTKTTLTGTVDLFKDDLIDQYGCFLLEKDKLLISLVVEGDEESTSSLFSFMRENLITLIGRGKTKLISESILCSHCLQSHSEPAELLYDNVLSHFLDSKEIVCGEIIVPLSKIIPEVVSLSVPIITDFEVYNVIGYGGFAQVFKGRLNNQLIAIKQLKLKPGDNMHSKFEEFRHEVFMMGDLDHPNVVKLHGITLKPFQMIMEFVPLGNLNSCLMNPDMDELLSWEVRLKIAKEIAYGMRYLHSHNPPIVHRDLRSPNIFISSLDPAAKTHAKVADFGLANYSMPVLFEMLPTWQWLAPEVINPLSKSYDERSDIYSYGIVLWEIASRSHPFAEFEQFITRSVTIFEEEKFHDKKTLLQLLKNIWTQEGKNQEEIELCLLDYTLVDIKQSIIAAFKKLGFRVEGTSLIREDFQRQNIIEAILYENLRPTLPKSCPTHFKELVQNLWQSTPELRFGWDVILTTLNSTLQTVCKSM